MKKHYLGWIVGCISLMFLLAGPAAAESSIKKKKVFRTEVRTTTFGGSCYILGFGVSDILNKKSASVKGSVLESTGTEENIRLVGQDKKRRKRTFFTCGQGPFEKAKLGKPPFDKKPELYEDLMIIVQTQKICQFPITLDPSIKTLADLKGKRVSTWPKGTYKYNCTYELIAGAGKDVVDSIKWQYTGYAGYDDMILGKVDVAWSFCAERGPGKFVTVPKLKELMSKRKVYFVTATPEMRKKTGEEFGSASGLTLTIPADNFGADVPRHKVLGFGSILGWAVYPDMPEEVVYELVKTIDENHGMFPEYHSAGKGIVPENYGAYPVEKKDWHPGARKYYDEKGIGYGKEYFDKKYPMQ